MGEEEGHICLASRRAFRGCSSHGGGARGVSDLSVGIRDTVENGRMR